MTVERTSRVPAVEGWFTIGAEPTLIGSRCLGCGNITFPASGHFCANPACHSREFESIALSRQGTVWSYTDAQYQPPAPYIAPPGEYVPFALAAVELVPERMVVLGQVAAGYGVADLSVGALVELVVEPLYEIDGVEHLIYRWKPVGAASGSA
jgi:uncharacterized OB-fold protein